MAKRSSSVKKKRASGKPKPPANPATPAVRVDAEALPLDREGRPILPGALIVEHPGSGPHPTFGRVIAAAGAVLLMRTFAGNEMIASEVDPGSVVWAVGKECSVIEGPLPQAALPPAAAAAVDVVARLAKIEGEIRLACSEVIGLKDMEAAADSISEAVNRMVGVVRLYVGEGDSDTTLADAIKAAAAGGGEGK